MIEIENYPDIKKRIKELDLNEPLSASILPRNFWEASSSNELLHESEAATVKIFLRNSGLGYEPLEKQKIGSILEQSIVDVIPIIYIPAIIISNNPDLFSVYIGLLSEYLYDKLKGTYRRDEVLLEYVVETEEGKYKKIKYKGKVDGMKEIPKIVESINDT